MAGQVPTTPSHPEPPRRDVVPGEHPNVGFSVDVDAYLARIGAVATDPVPTLQHAHLRSVPFENLSIHLDDPLSLDPAALEDKIVARRRGGFCYELNGLFSLLLAELGHTVELLSARVHGDAGFGPPLDHLALRVGDLLVDVGFGAHSVFPLRLDTQAEQPDPGGTFRIVPADHGERVVLKDGTRPTCWRTGRTSCATSRPCAGGSRTPRACVSRHRWSARGSPTPAGSRWPDRSSSRPSPANSSGKCSPTTPQCSPPTGSASGSTWSGCHG